MASVVTTWVAASGGPPGSPYFSPLGLTCSSGCPQNIAHGYDQNNNSIWVASGIPGAGFIWANNPSGMWASSSGTYTGITIHQVAYGAGTWVAVGKKSSGAGIIYNTTIPSGIWTESSGYVSTVGFPYLCVTYANSTWVVGCGNNGTTNITQSSIISATNPVTGPWKNASGSPFY